MCMCVCERERECVCVCVVCVRVFFVVAVCVCVVCMCADACCVCMHVYVCDCMQCMHGSTSVCVESCLCDHALCVYIYQNCSNADLKESQRCLNFYLQKVSLLLSLWWLARQLLQVWKRKKEKNVCSMNHPCGSSTSNWCYHSLALPAVCHIHGKMRGNVVKVSTRGVVHLRTYQQAVTQELNAANIQF